MAAFKNTLTLLLLCAFAGLAFCQISQGGPHVSQGGGHVSQGGAHENQGGAHEVQGRRRRQAEEARTPVPCDITTTPKFSCHDCRARLICTPKGGYVAPCWNPRMPYCYNGSCSFAPGPECA